MRVQYRWDTLTAAIHCYSRHLCFHFTAKYVTVNCNCAQFCKKLLSLPLTVYSVCAIPEKLGTIYTERTYKFVKKLLAL